MGGGKGRQPGRFAGSRGRRCPGDGSEAGPRPHSDILKNGVNGVASGAEAVPVTGKIFHYEIPQGGGDREIRLVILDDSGEKGLFKGIKSPGSKWTCP